MHTSLLTILAAAWFLLYWLFGGVFFSIIGFLRIGRLQKARFGCFFSLVSFGMGVFAAWAGTQLMRVDGMMCFLDVRGTRWQLLIDQFTCGIIPILTTFVAGFIVLVIVGWWLMTISTRQDVNWIATPEVLPDENAHAGGHEQTTHDEHVTHAPIESLMADEPDLHHESSAETHH